MTKRRDQYKKVVRGFTDQVKKELEKVYPLYFNSNNRISDATQFFINSSISIVALVGNNTVTIQERFVHYKQEDQPLYFDIIHTNAHGQFVPSTSCKSKANIIAYCIYDEEKESLEKVYFLNTDYLKKAAKEELANHLINVMDKQVKIKPKLPENLHLIMGAPLKNGEPYRQYSLTINIKDLPPEAFFTINGEKIIYTKYNQQ